MKKAEDKAGSQIRLILNHDLHGVLSGSPSGTSWARGMRCCRGVGGRLCSYCASGDARLPSRVCGSQPGPPPRCGCGVHGSLPGPPSLPQVWDAWVSAGTPPLANMGCTGLSRAPPLPWVWSAQVSAGPPLPLRMWGAQISAGPRGPGRAGRCGEQTLVITQKPVSWQYQAMTSSGNQSPGVCSLSLFDT